MPTFMLVLRDRPEDFRELSPQEMQRMIAEYRAWGRRLEEAGRLEGGHKLADEGGRVLRASAGRIAVKDGPFAETKEVVSGYFLIRARDYDEAVELCHDHPHLRYGGPIELRQVDELDGAGA